MATWAEHAHLPCRWSLNTGRFGTLIPSMQHVLQACEGRKKLVVFGPTQLGLVLPCGVLGCACLAQGSPGQPARHFGEPWRDLAHGEPVLAWRQFSAWRALGLAS